MSGAGISRSFREKFKPSVWIGTTDDLSRLVSSCRELELNRQNAVRALHMTSEADRKAKRVEQWSYLSAKEKKERWSDENDKYLESQISGATLRMEVVSKSYEERLYGDPDKILLELERPKDVKSFELLLGRQGYSSNTAEGTGFRLVADGDGASVTIFGYDKDWVDLTTSRLKNVLLEQRPWYFWMATTWFGVVLSLAVAGGWFILFGWIFGTSNPVWILGLGPAFLSIILASVYWDKALPKFELFRPDSRARGSRAIAVTASAAVWLIGTIVIPLLLR